MIEEANRFFQLHDPVLNADLWFKASNIQICFVRGGLGTEFIIKIL